MSKISLSYSGAVEVFEPMEKKLDETRVAFRNSLGKEWANKIGGQLCRDGTTYEIRSPADSDVLLGTFIDASEEAVGRAVRAARDASSSWERLGWRERVTLLRRVAGEIDARMAQLAWASVLEVGKSRVGALGEVLESIELIEYYCSQMDRNEGYTFPLSETSNELSINTQRPYGVFGIIAPFNFPIALSAGMLGAALVTGNSVVFKPSPGAGLSGSLLTEAFEAADLPKGVFNLVCGPNAGQRLVDAPGVDGIAFTGSHKAGMEINRRMKCGPFARPVIAEMGGKNPVYVTASADLPIATKAVLRSAFGLQGQVCTACSVAFVHEDLHDGFIGDLTSALQGLTFGDVSDRQTTDGPLINEAAYHRFRNAVEEAKAIGALVTGGDRLSGGIFERGYYVRPAIVTDLPERHRLFEEELFSPILAVRRFTSLDQALEYGNAAPLGLAAAFYGKDHSEIDLFLERAEAGVLAVNRATGATTGAWPGRQSFCGWKGSGLTGKGGLGPNFVPQFMREQSRTFQR
ncbi:1-pyrroline-5-carboxylate dehydrogenase [Bradyrhizobium sp. CIR18]|uniref:aldehyde dehydrogenase family protein n=1 Tax=Bradyrhizobium sp. CIR18 TaxID=2663839 RepID=UPI001605B204|nr:aldehyde dehydrogenase family protein [Bradyrhizobium sp. CIR18]MBB4367114.1 1-pyrroline-5-carboxylate dehydrogenase [Bradyrhizobium sp. CIR18]